MFNVGDYVIADRAMYDGFNGRTFVIVGFSKNLIGETLVQAREIDKPGSDVTHFYPSELSWEDGTRP